MASNSMPAAGDDASVATGFGADEPPAHAAAARTAPASKAQTDRSRARMLYHR
jgi:hypothetical protein